MEANVAKMHKYLKIRGKKYYLRVPIPKEIQEIMGKKEILRSLKTSDLVQANLRYPDALAKIQKEFVIAKSKTKQMASVPLVLTLLRLFMIGFTQNMQKLHSSIDRNFQTMYK